MVVMKNVEIPNWLKGLPFAPVFRPTETEFADPIAYISKIEKQASDFGICKIIPPLPKPSKKFVLHNLNRSLSKSRDSSSLLNNNNHPDVPAVFTTRQQALGKPAKKSRGASQPHQLDVHKQVWQSGEVYTLQQFESKSKAFAHGLLSMVKEVSPLVLEAMFWNASTEKPIYIEYANDVPGSGFSEPEGSHRYFLKRIRRRRLFRENHGATSGCKKNDLNTPGDSVNNVNSVTSVKVNLKLPIKVEYSGSSTSLLDEISQVSSEKNSTAISENEMEGTAGWKLSNSPWNLQVIARSPGSLTRFMPDDIPGVTSPMVYIGMMFSWFAWHVEDHELHSMNYLHTGSPKTWYAVPGDYAFKFEEVIRTQAYGGNIDRLGALKLLGAKTTLLSPEVVVAAGIPCCRLIQHPGEFVVTFPRAYHVGFSHGFNCGEAANFGTPQWLQVAKEAAVRRAAMNHLPMLSHQQLLYLLTMSFVSRFPRSLLPGVRNSRLRDRQKEEREKAVKQAFLEDIVKENKLSTVLLAKNSSYRAVSWHPESLPSYSKKSPLAGQIAAAADTKSQEIPANSNTCINKNTNLFDEMTLFMETGDEIYLDDDLSCDFQVGYGSLACVACGILGFPFLSIIQPSHRAAIELARTEYSSMSSQSINTPDSLDGGVIMGAVSENISPVRDISVCQEDVTDLSTTALHEEWNTSSEFLKPQIFCLEHAVQIEKLLRSRGGANVLVICHADYQKMKAHATVISEEFGCSLRSKEIPLVCASQKDLDLINHAIEEEVHDEFWQDWTSKLGINLRHCVKVRKKSPQKIQHVLTLSGLFYDMIPASTSHLNWESRRSRSKLKLNNSICSKNCKSFNINHEEPMQIAGDTKADKIIQYSRRNRKFKSGNTKISSTCINMSVEAQHEYQTSDKFPVANKACYLEMNDSFKICSEMKIYKEANTTSLTSFAAKSSSLSIHTPVEPQRDIIMEETNLTNNTEAQYDMQADKDPLSIIACELANPASSQVCDLVDGNVYNANCHISDHTVVDNDNPENVEDPDSRESCAANGCSGSVMEENMLQEIQIRDRGAPAEESASKYDILMYEPSIDPIRVSSDVLTETCCVEDIGNGSSLNDKVSHGTEVNRAKEIVRYVSQRNQPNVVLVDERSKLSQETCVTENLWAGVSSNETQKPNKSFEKGSLVGKSDKGSKETGTAYDLIKCAGSDGKILSFVAVEDGCEVLKAISTDKNLHSDAKVIIKENNELKNVESSTSKAERKRKREAEHQCNYNGFFKSPCEGLRPRARKDEAVINVTGKKPVSKKVKKAFSSSVPVTGKKEKLNGPHRCGLDGCRMKFKTKAELVTHKHNHEDDRPLKCSWKGCKMSFRWAWARTEHLRVHTGEKPYHCKGEGCGLSFRFISEFSRHRRKTNHYAS